MNENGKRINQDMSFFQFLKPCLFHISLRMLSHRWSHIFARKHDITRGTRKIF